MQHRYLFSTALGFLVGSCALAPQTVRVQPQIQLSASDLARGRKVFVDVADERSNTPRLPGAPDPAAAVRVHGELDGIVRAGAEDALRKLGFTIAQERGDDDAELRIEIRSLDYTMQSGSWSAAAQAQSTMNGICLIGATRAYEQLYRGAHDETVALLQASSGKERSVNAALSQALRSLVTDPSLLSCLVEPAAP